MNKKAKRSFPAGKKVYFIDTSAIMHDPTVVEKLASDGNVVVLSVCVLAELDKAKNFQDEKGINARTVSRLLDEYRALGSLSTGVRTKRGGAIVVDCNGTDRSFKKFMLGTEKTNDNRIIATALQWKADSGGQYEKIALITKDINLRVTASAFGLDAEDYESDKSIQKLDELYDGFARLSLDEPELVGEIHRNGHFPVSRLSEVSRGQISALFPNQCLELEVNGKTVLAVLKKAEGVLKCVQKPRPAENSKKSRISVSPRNNEQALAMALLMDPSISLVALSGTAGTGKTLITLLAAYEQLNSPYSQINVFRPNEEIGNKMGFLPGDIDEKFAPWTEPIIDNLKVLLRPVDGQAAGKLSGNREERRITIDHLLEKGIIEILPLNFIRGRSIGDSFIIVDETQNITPKAVKTILTRAGEGTKIVLTGDCSQIDTPYLDPVSNGLTYVIEKLKGEELFGTITLRKGERSEISRMIAERL